MRDSWMNWMRAAALSALVATVGCGAVKEKKVVTAPPAYAAARTATAEELVSLINDQYANVDSLTVRRCDVEFTGGSIDDGYLEKYRKANGLMIAQDPGSIFVNILNPLTNSTVVVMASRNEQFQIWIPSKNTFVTGPTNVTPEEDNPIYNVRPSHILEGVLLEPIPVDDPDSRFFVIEDQDDRYKYYVIGVFELGSGTPDAKLVRRLWIERSSLRLKKQQYFDGTEVVSTIDYEVPMEVQGRLVNTKVKIERPRDRYSIAFSMKADNIKLDRPLKPEAFEIQQPAGAEIVIVD